MSKNSNTLIYLCLFCLLYLIAEQADKIKRLEARRPEIIYKVDNVGGVMAGQITDKEIIEGRYTVTAEAYGKFLVTKEQYEELKVGDQIPDYLKKRGS